MGEEAKATRGEEYDEQQQKKAEPQQKQQMKKEVKIGWFHEWLRFRKLNYKIEGQRRLFEKKVII